MSLDIAINADASDTSTITLAGRLDSNTAPTLDEALNRVLPDTSIKRLVFDIGALEYLSSAGIRTIALTGKSGGKLGALADIEINVPRSETSHVQEAHIAVGPQIACLVEHELYPRP